MNSCSSSVIVALARLALAGMVGATLGAQTPDGVLPIDTLNFALTTPGVPLRLKQVQVRTRQKADGSSTTEESTSVLYRDNAGRVRNEQQGGAFVVIRDPVGRQVVYLLVRERRAFRVRAPDAVKDVGFTGGSLGGPAMPREWKAKREELPPRLIEGVECEGTRWTYVDPDDQTRTAFHEEWGSRPMGLIALVSGSVPGDTFTARIENLVRGEPDAALFAVPMDYVITDLQDK